MAGRQLRKTLSSRYTPPVEFFSILKSGLGGIGYKKLKIARNKPGFYIFGISRIVFLPSSAIFPSSLEIGKSFRRLAS